MITFEKLIKMDREENCLICSSKNVPLQTLDCSVEWSFDKSILFPSSTSLLDNQLQVILLLRKVLRLSKQFIEKHLVRSGGCNPSEWNLKLCGVCHKIVEEASFVWSRMNRLHREFDQLSHGLRCKLVTTTGSNVDDELEKISPRGRKRKGGRPPKRLKGGGVNEFGDRNGEGEASLLAEIRREVVLQKRQGGEILPPMLTMEIVPENEKKAAETEPEKHIDLELEVNNSDVELPVDDLFDCNDDGMEGDNDADDISFAGEEEEVTNDNDVDVDFIPDVDNDMEEDEELAEVESDSDYEPDSKSTLKRRKSSKRGGSSKSSRKKRMSCLGLENWHEKGMIPKAIKMENKQSVECSKCQRIFETSALCNEHILTEHYKGFLPNGFACPICPEKMFKGEFWLRYHMQMRHPGEKLPTDELLEQCIEDGVATEVTYEVVPVPESEKDKKGEKKPKELKEPYQRVNLAPQCVEEPLPGEFCVPVLQPSGKNTYLVMCKEFGQMPEEFLSLVKHEEKECPRCLKKMPTELQLQGHIKLAHEGVKYPYWCIYCPRKFSRVGPLLGHAQHIHLRKKKHFCERCGKTFKEQIILQAHIQRVHFGVRHPYKCTICGKRHPRRNALNLHLQRAHNLQIAFYVPEGHGGRGNARPKPPKSNRRPGRPKWKPDLRVNGCDHCDSKFAKVEELDDHVKKVHMGITKPYACTICPKRYSYASNLDAHLATHTVPNNVEVGKELEHLLRFTCHPCNKRFKTQHLLNVHMLGTIHKNHRPYVCEICSQAFRGLEFLKNHQAQKHHEELNITPHKCPHCDKIFSCERSLNNHVQCIHLKTGKYPCPYPKCSFCSMHEKALTLHISQKHAKSNRVLCPYCPKLLACQYFSQHLRVHTGEKPYECQFCQKKFSDRPTYKRHVEAHSNVTHKCPQCGKGAFKTRHALRVHVRTVHEEQDKEESDTEPQAPSSSSALWTDQTQPKQEQF